MSDLAQIAPPYSLVLVEDETGGELPDMVEGSRIAATDSCVAVGTRCEIDDETEFRLGAHPDVDPGTQPIFQGRLETPSRRLAIRSVLNEIILQTPVPLPETMIYIRVNHPTEPDQVIVGTA